MATDLSIKQVISPWYVCTTTIGWYPLARWYDIVNLYAHVSIAQTSKRVGYTISHKGTIAVLS